jgi:hypothetical protein
MADEKEPFWKDGPGKPTAKLPSSLSFIAIIFHTLPTLVLLGAFIFVFYSFSHLLAWIFVFLAILYLVFIIYRINKNAINVKKIPIIQEKARQISGASFIGSAVHVAGHPLLKREQEVVLALSPEGLKIFPYNDDHPIDILIPERMEKIYTITYDDERVPHIDVIDSTAQALQFTYKEANKEYTCLFRRMRNVRPIDWYHELQKVRFNQTQ